MTRVYRLLAFVCAAGLQLASAHSLLAQVAGELRGRVTEAGESRPLSNSRIELSGRTDVVRTSADGSYVIRGLEPLSYTVTVRAVGYATRTYEVEITNGRTSVIDAELERVVVSLDQFSVRGQRDSTGGNATVFGRAEIERSGRRDVGELLQSVPGVVITQAGGPGQPSTVSIRGSTSGQVLVLVDGVALNSALSGGADLSRIPLENVGSVTVRTGAQSARYGPRAMAGVIEIKTRQAQREVSALVRGGALGEKDGALTLSGTRAAGLMNVGASATGDYRTVDGDFRFTLPALRGGGRATRINADATSRSLNGALSVEGGFGNAALRGNWQETERGMSGSIIQPSNTGRQTHSRKSGGTSAQGSRRSLAWTVAADITKERGTFTDSTPPFGEAYADTIHATGITASGSATVMRSMFTLASGVELRTLDISSTMLAADAPHWQGLTGEWINMRAQRTLGASVNIEGELSGRLDQNSLAKNNTFSPRVATRLSRSSLALSASFGSGYAPPTLSDQFFHEGVQVRANPNLRAERTTHDVELRLSLLEQDLGKLQLSGDLATYRSDVSGMILWFPDFRFIWSPSNYDVHRNGWEANGTARIPAARLELRASFNHNEVTYAGGVLSGQVTYRPRETFNSQIAFAPAIARVDFTMRHIGTRRTIAGSSLNSLDPYWISDARISRSFAVVGWDLQSAVSVENALNQQAAMLVDYPFPPRTWTVSLRVRRSNSSLR